MHTQRTPAGISGKKILVASAAIMAFGSAALAETGSPDNFGIDSLLLGGEHVVYLDASLMSEPVDDMTDDLFSDEVLARGSDDHLLAPLGGAIVDFGGETVSELTNYDLQAPMGGAMTVDEAALEMLVLGSASAAGPMFEWNGSGPGATFTIAYNGSFEAFGAGTVEETGETWGQPLQFAV